MDWIWEDFDDSSRDPVDGVQVFEPFVDGDDDDDDDEGEDEDDDDYGLHDDGDESDGGCGSGSDVSCSLLTRDRKTAQEVYDIIEDVKRRYYGRGDRHDEADGPDPTAAAAAAVDHDFDDDEQRLGDGGGGGEEAAVHGFYADAVEAAATLLSEVQLVWADTLHKCTVNE